MEKCFYIYILASAPYGYLYVGMTNNLQRRVFEHQHGLIEGYTKQRNIHQLVYFESTDNPASAITREKQLKRYPRQWKFNLVERNNPHWQDLTHTLS